MLSLIYLLCLLHGGFDAMNLFTRFKAWLHGTRNTEHVQKSGSFPFNRVTEIGGSTGPKLTQAYRQSPWVNRAIKLVSLPITEVPLRFSTDGRGGKQTVDDPALLAYWEAPALGPDGQPMPFVDVVEATVGWLKLKGNSFWLLDDSTLADPARLPFPEAGLSLKPFIVARPDRMRPVKDKRSGALLGWEFTDGAGTRHAMDISQVIHLKLWNPYDDCLGLGELEPAQNPAEADYLASQYEVNLWRNNGDRGPIIGLPGGTMLTDSQREQFVAQLREKRELASRGIFKAAFVDADIKVEDPKVQSIDSAVIASMANDATKIAIAFGVPPSMFTVAASYSIGSASDRFRLIEDTSAPIGKKLTEGIERIVNRSPSPPSGERAGVRGRRLYAWLDWSKHSVFAQVRAERVDKGAILWDRGVAWSTINDFLDLGLPEFDGWDERYLPFSISPADQLAERQEQEAADFSEPGDNAADAPPQSGNDTADDDDKAVKGMLAALRCKVVKGRSRYELTLLRAHELARRPAIKRFENAFERVLKKARAQVLDKLNSAAGAKADTTKATAAEFLFDLSSFTEQFRVEMRRASNAALQSAGQQLFAEVGLDDAFKFPPEKALTFLGQRENKLSGVPQEVFNQVKSKIETGLKEGQSIAEISAAVKDEFNDISKGRARTVAMTETAAAYGSARQDAMEQSGVPFKKWLTSGAPNVRPAHQDANGQTVPVDAAFIVGGEPLDGPCDPSGSPGNTINCHCVAIAVMKETGEIEA